MMCENDCGFRETLQESSRVVVSKDACAELREGGEVGGEVGTKNSDLAKS